MEHLIIGCGYLGARVAARWHLLGHRVFVTTRRPEHAASLRALGFEPIVVNVLEPATLRTLPQVDSVLYCVGFDRTAGAPMHSVYVGGLANVLAALPPPRGRFIYVSSTGVYGQKAGEEVDEESSTEPEEEAGRIVLEAERSLREHARQALILRFAGMYGPGRILRRQAIANGEPIVGDAEKWLNLIHVDDGVEAVLAAEQRGDVSRPIYNVSDGVPVRRRDFYTTLARLLGAPPPRFMPPEPGSPPPPHERANRRIRNRRLLEELGVQLQYPSYESGLAASLAE
jgi:nucleoside-diphosphate-sugar epimerase